MKFEILEGHSNYAAQPVKLTHFYPIEGADKIVRAVVFGNDVVIAKDSYKIGDTVLYFRSGTRLSEDYCKYNNLYESPENNVNPDSKGYISFRNRRVKAIKLRGTLSDGMLMPIISIIPLLHDNIDWSLIKEGNDFNVIDGVLICDKYEVPITQKVNINGTPSSEPKNKLKNLLVDKQFKFHHETSHMAKNLFKLSLDSWVTITEKFHGSSVILAKVKVKRKLSWLEQIAQKYFKLPIVDTEYKGIWSSGKPKSNLPKGIEGLWQNKGNSFYEKDIWAKCWDDYNYAVEPGISIYGELCNAGIQKGYDYSHYIHPNPDHPKDYVFVVYRITRTNDVGITDEFTWDQIKWYCDKYDLQTVPVLYEGYVSYWSSLSSKSTLPTADDVFAMWQDMFLEKSHCRYCINKVPNEGICIRVDTPLEVWKMKSKLFTKNENDAQEAGEVNIEDQQ